MNSFRIRAHHALPNDNLPYVSRGCCGVPSNNATHCIGCGAPYYNSEPRPQALFPMAITFFMIGRNTFGGRCLKCNGDLFMLVNFDKHEWECVGCNKR